VNAPILGYRAPVSSFIREQSLAVRVLVAGLIGLGWLALGGAILLLACGVAWAVGAVVMVPTFILLVVILMSLPHMRSAIRRRRATAILGYLEQAVRLNLPLVPMLDAASRSESRVLARRLAELADVLRAGVPLSVALVHVPELPLRATALLATAERTGSLAAAFRRLLHEDGQLHRDRSLGNGIFVSAYMSSYPIMAIAVLAVVVIYVMPRLERILLDFKLPLPQVTQWLIALTSGYWLLLMAGIIALICVLWIGSKLWDLFVPRSIVGPFRVLQLLAWWTPLLGRAIRDRGLGDVFRVLADSARAGLPLPLALLEAGSLRLNCAQGMQIQSWREGVEQGLSMSEAARRAGLPPLAVGLMSSAQAGAGSHEAFEFLSTYYAGRFSRCAILLRSALIPVMTLLFGAIVLFIAASIFTPIIRLTELLAGIERML
jgi:type IV pilus assembly protein PilC